MPEREEFLAGTVEHSMDAAVQEGKVHSRLVVLRTAAGAEVHVHDPSPPVSGGLAPGERVVVAAALRRAKVARAAGAAQGTDGERGRVAALEWRGAAAGFRTARAGLLERSWALLATEHGRVLLDPADLPAGAAEGDELAWTGGRLELEGIFA